MTGTAGKHGSVSTALRSTVLASVVFIWLSLARAAERTSRHPARREGRDRGDVLASTALTVGLVLLAGAVLFALRNKADSIVDNVCTNADPSTC
jgi:hypothetical protein